MRTSSAVAASRVAGLLLMALAAMPAGLAAGVNAKLRASSEYGKLPLSFELNRGQTDSRVKYISRGAGYTLFLTPTDTVLSLAGVDREQKRVATSLRMTFAGAREATLRGLDVQPGFSSYFMGSDKVAWRTGVRHFGRVAYRGIYPGIDAVFYGNQRQLEYDFIVAPGADPSQIRLKFEGVRSLETAPNGDLVLRTVLGDVRQLRPVIYQEVNGQRRIVEGHYAVRDNEARFEIASYDRRKPLVIDPVLAWSTFWGGTGSDTISGIAVDSTSNIIVTGFTSSNDFNASVRFPGVTRGGASDAFVTKFATNGGSIAWSAFYGGQGQDEARSVAVDSDNSVYITGRTDTPSTNGIGFPLVKALQDTLGGATDAFVAKISADGTTLLLSTYLGGFGEEIGNHIAVDAQKQPVVVGTTASTNFWATALFPAFNGGTSDAFVTKFKAEEPGLVWSTYLGGTAADTARGVAVDSTGAVYVTGSTRSFSFPRTSGVVQGAIGSQNINGTFVEDAYVTKISATGTLVYSTFLGGLGYDAGAGIAVDADGTAYVFGDTESTNYPIFSPFQGSNQGNRDTFVTKLNATASAYLYSTFLGGTGSEQAGDIVVRTGIAYVAGSTTSTNFPLAGAGQILNAGGYDAFVTQINTAGTALTSSTYLGGSLDDIATGITLDASQNIYVAGFTQSFNFPAANGIQKTFVGVQDGFVAKLSNCTVTLTPTLPGGAPGFLHSNAAQSGTITVTGASDCTWNQQTNATWITLGTASAISGNGTLSYSITQNTRASRSGIITIAGAQFTVQQQAGPPPSSGCVYPLQPDVIIALGNGASGTFQLDTSSNTCAWTATSNVPWLQAFPIQGTDTTTVNYTVYPNFGTGNRVGVVSVTAMGVTQAFTVTQIPTFLSEPERFVTLLYSNFIGRYPSTSEIAFQTSALISGQQTRGTMCASFFNTPEFQLGGRFVAGLYEGLLGRVAEFGGWRFQRNVLAVNLATQDQLVANFLGSNEYMLKYGVQTNEQFVTMLYQQVLGRSPSPDELAHQAGFLNNGTLTRVQLATNFLNSAEFRIRLASRLSAFLLYAALLQRDPNPTELNNRKLQLDAGTPISTLCDQFILSAEFQTQLQ